ncbi:hypothetical protein Hrd1104_01335 [Halorhabdus sp. CBA1104]|uniref:hypothetical protein n=1 Tax=unclassified Halorhabdus TaxID=2621901 RepID=UPI0012B36A33|nr:MULTISPECIES: hypothetical protein [unclassified Halorhabdus]QGN06066.1 hypothetical protein Hrd1104_01335 [Halorhabdus sp. CBA1104]
MSDDDDPDGDSHSAADEDTAAGDPFEAISAGDDAPLAPTDGGDEDPFERIDVDDRPADPFADLGDQQADARGDAASETGRFDAFGYDDRTDSTPADAAHQPETGADADEQPVVDSDVDDPFDRLGVDRRGEAPFDRLGEGRVVDAERDSELWEALSRSEAEPETERQGQRRFAEVDKHSYCERCEYFSKPPDVACSNDGTDIIEFVDSETVRVADCPIVAEREELADYEPD